MANPVATMEKLTGEKVNLPEGQKLTVVDQSDESTVYFNIPKRVEIDNLQLTEEQLEQVAGGITPTFIAFGYGFVVGEPKMVWSLGVNGLNILLYDGLLYIILLIQYNSISIYYQILYVSLLTLNNF